MKKYLLVLAALSLTGCAYGQYKTSYFQEYAGYDCAALEREMSTARSAAQLDWERSRKRKGSYRGGGRPNNVEQVQMYGSSEGVSHKYVSLLPGVGSRPSPGQKRRMRNHAQQQAILQLETDRGCRSNAAALNSGE